MMEIVVTHLHEAMKHAQQELNMINKVEVVFLLAKGTKSTSFHYME